mmetsp:Transcript_96031/g.200602  ORF Transcript_96031/g.200602 Transcript_96031/m.200602 type:complete len:275 (-) Transcript_96031:92-916(-)
MDEVVIQVDPERLGVYLHLLVVDHPAHRDLAQLPAALQDLRPELLEHVAGHQEPEDGGEDLDVLEVLRAHELLEGRDLGGIHREDVGADAHDAVQEQDHRRVALVVLCTVVVAEADVVHEGSIGMLHLEVALVEHEAEDGLGDRRRLRDGLILDLDGLDDFVGPMGGPRELFPHEGPRDLALQGEEDGGVKVEGGVLGLDAAAAMVNSLPMGDSGLTFHVHHRDEDVPLHLELALLCEPHGLVLRLPPAEGQVDDGSQAGILGGAQQLREHGGL